MPVHYERDGHVAIITLDSPERGNALDYQALTVDLPEAWQQAATDPLVGSVVVTGTGRQFFCTGVDVKDSIMVEISSGRRPAFPIMVTGRQNNVWKPIITAVNGLCVGGGLMFIADSDITIGSTHAAFSNPGVSIGIAAHMGGVVLTRSADFHSVLRMTLLGRHGRIDALAGLAAGFLSEVVDPDQLLDHALRLAADVASNSPAAVSDALHTLWGALELPLTEARAMSAERANCFREDPDATEGLRALAEGRPPVWATYRDKS